MLLEIHIYLVSLALTNHEPKLLPTLPINSCMNTGVVSLISSLDLLLKIMKNMN